MSDGLYPDEASFHAAWIEVCGAGSEVELALAGGGLADRLSWVFMSGYQAAVRRCFSEFRFPRGWTCFAAAEPEDGPSCVLSREGDEYRLDGVKSWIAGASLIEHLVVAIGQGDERRFVQVRRADPGVTISQPREPGFLGEMSQGVARFEAVQVKSSDLVQDPARALWFKGAEPLFVLLALNACLKRCGEANGDTRLVIAAGAAIAAGEPLAEVLAEKDTILPGLQRLRTLTGQTVSAATSTVQSDRVLARSWQSDGRLLKMFGVEASDS